MANTAEGITVGDEGGLDPNDPHDFAAIMEGRGVAKTDEDTDTSDTSIAAGLTYAEPGQPAATPERDEKGRFVSNQERAAAASDTGATAATDTSGEDGAVADPEIEAFLAKYDGDVEKALKGAANAQSLIGRRDEDKERLERELAELRGRLDGFMAAGQRQQSPAALSNDQIEEIATSRVETLGYSDAATEAANLAHTQGDERAYRTILSQWMLEDPAAAMDFNTDFRLWQREQRAAAETTEAPAWLSRVEEQAKVEQYGKGFESLRAEIGPEAFAQVASQFDAALEQMPPNVLQMIDSEDAEARDAGFRIVADRALRLAAATPAAPAPSSAATQAAEALAARKLAGARVASGALRPAEKRPDAPANREDAIKEFKRQIVEAPTTNIASGLTYGPTP